MTADGPNGDALKSAWKPLKKIFALAGLVLAIAAAITVARIFYGRNNFVGVSEKVFYINRGESFATVVDSLESQGIIRSRELFILVAKLRGGTSRMRAGKYVFQSGVSNAELCSLMIDGRGMKLIAVTIPEGKVARFQAKIFSRVLGIDSTRYMTIAHSDSFAHALGVDAPTLEGYLLPETYSFFWQPDEKEIIKRQVATFMLFYNDSLRERAEEFGWTTNQVVTFASIVEGEAVLNDERSIISGVYHNRLRKHMRLEADPTIRFMLDDAPRRVLYSDLKVDNPYNTYRIEGLPPGPINSPGKASILAALYPAQHNYYYFVANGKGGHWFSSTYEDHVKNVRKYRRERARYRAQMRARNSTALLEHKDTSTANAARDRIFKKN